MSTCSRTDFIATACSVLAEDGADGVTIAALCDRLFVTKGSFYYHFAGMPGFIEAFAETWELEFQSLLAVVRAEPDPMRRLELMTNYAFTMSHSLQAAVRSWGNTNDVLSKSLARVDSGVEEVLRDALEILTDDPHRAGMLAHMGVSLIIGLQLRDRPVDEVRFSEICLEWLHACLRLHAELRTEDGTPTLHLGPRVGG